MDHTFLVRCLQAFADFDPVFQDLRWRKRSLDQPICQSLAFQKLHYEIVHSVLMADVMQSADVRMVEGRNSTCFAVEALFGLRIVRKMCGQNLYGDGAVESSVTGALVLTHTARAERRLNFIRAELAARSKGHRCA